MSAANSISLWHLQNRMKFDNLLKERHPEQKDILDKRIAQTKELIVEAVMQMDENLAATIHLRRDNK